MSQTESLLRRMTGSISEYVNTVGMRPLRLSDYDKAVLAIRDGDMLAFKESYPKALKDHAGDLLIEAAGRPGSVGRKMTLLLLADMEQFPETAYRTACQKAVDINDPEKVLFLLEQAESHVQDLPSSFHGEMASYAYFEHRFIATEIIKQCSEAQITTAPPRLLEQVAADKNFHALSTLVEKGISGGPNAWRVLHMLTCQKSDCWLAEELLKERMWVATNDYSALHACIQNDAVDVCKRLLDGGIDFDVYQQWAKNYPYDGHEETTQALSDYWSEMQAAQEQAPTSQEIGGMTLG